MRKYEIMYIVRPNIDEETRKAVIAKFSSIITDGGSEILEVNEWGNRDLAYEIQDFKKGYYVVLTISANVESINEFDRVAHISEDILRYIIVKEEE